jgi:AI-2 transport protein TqsA
MPAPSRRPGPILRDGEASRNWLLGAILVVLALWAMHAAASVAVLVLGGLFAALVVVPVDRAAQDRLPDAFAWVGHLAALLVLLVGLVVLAGALAFCAMRVAGEFQSLGGQGVPGLSDVTGGGGEEGSSGGSLRSFLASWNVEVSTLISRISERVTGFITGALSGAATIVTGILLVVFLALMMLVDAPRWHRRLGVASDRAAHWFDAFETLGLRVRRFFLVRFAMGLVTAALYGAWLWFMGVDLVWTWMILTVILAFVPTLGSIVSGVLPTIYAAFTKDIGTAVAVGAGLLAIEQVIGNFLDPKIAGEQVAVSPLVVLVGLLVWGFVLGAVGTLLATPVTLAIIIFGARIEALRPLALMLSNCEDWDDLDRMTTP